MNLQYPAINSGSWPKEGVVEHETLRPAGRSLRANDPMQKLRWQILVIFPGKKKKHIEN